MRASLCLTHRKRGGEEGVCVCALVRRHAIICINSANSGLACSFLIIYSFKLAINEANHVALAASIPSSAASFGRNEMLKSQEALWLAELGKCCIDLSRWVVCRCCFARLVVLLVRMELKQVKGQRGQEVS